METKKKIIIIGSSLVLAYGLALLVFWIITKINENKSYGGNDEDGSDEDGSDEASTEKTNKLSSDYPLKRGSVTPKSKGENIGVWAIQNICLGMTYDPKKDGVWGQATETAVDALVNTKYYLIDNGLMKQVPIYPFRNYFTERTDADAQKAIWEISFDNYQKLCKFWKNNKDDFKYKKWYLDDAHITFNN